MTPCPYSVKNLYIENLRNKQDGRPLTKAPKSLTDAFPRMSLVEKQGRALRQLVRVMPGLLETITPPEKPLSKDSVPFLPPAPDSEVK